MLDPTAERTTLGSTLETIVPMAVIFGAMFWMMNSSQRKEKKKKEELLNSLKKDQKVQTIGGIIGTIEEIKDQEVLLLVDSRNKGYLTVSKDSISTTL
jgi:preprotein translocase subunit YajC